MPRHSGSSSCSAPSRVRIIGGQWRGRWIHFLPADGLRPTGDRMRETLFNWLQPVLAGARCGDLFAGSGALGIEAVSRGAASAVLVESNVAVVQQLDGEIRKLETAAVRVWRGEALEFVAAVSEPLDIVFVDPPFSAAVQLDVLHSLTRPDVLSDGASIYVEAPVDSRLQKNLPEGFTVHRAKTQSRVECLLLHWH